MKAISRQSRRATSDKSHPHEAQRSEAMFTGLVETMGRLVELIDQPPGKRLRIDAGSTIADGVSIGDSICCSGCCLTVVAASGNLLDFEAGEETLSRTGLGRLQIGDGINLERSLKVGDRLGGHYVSGHVDALAELIRIEPDPPWAKLWFRLPDHLASGEKVSGTFCAKHPEGEFLAKGTRHHFPALAAQIASKGSVTLDGVSLTVVDAAESTFSVALIPHTLAVTTLGTRRVGDSVNLETDILAKYIQRQLEARGL